MWYALKAWFSPYQWMCHCHLQSLLVTSSKMIDREVTISFLWMFWVLFCPIGFGLCLTLYSLFWQLYGLIQIFIVQSWQYGNATFFYWIKWGYGFKEMFHQEIKKKKYHALVSNFAFRNSCNINNLACSITLGKSGIEFF